MYFQKEYVQVSICHHTLHRLISQCASAHSNSLRLRMLTMRPGTCGRQDRLRAEVPA